MTRNEDTIEQLRFLAENWHRLSIWTQLQIIVTVWLYVKVRRPMRRLARYLGLSAAERQILTWLLLALFAGVVAVVAAAILANSPNGFHAPLSLILALTSAVFMIGLGLLGNGR